MSEGQRERERKSQEGQREKEKEGEKRGLPEVGLVLADVGLKLMNCEIMT